MTLTKRLMIHSHAAPTWREVFDHWHEQRVPDVECTTYDVELYEDPSLP